jgi:hypothetical protein
MSRPPEHRVVVSVNCETDHPDLLEFVDRVDATEPGSLERYRALAELVTECYHIHLATASYDRGDRDGQDAGASPFLDGPWWRRAWTAARS